MLKPMLNINVKINYKHKSSSIMILERARWGTFKVSVSQTVYHYTGEDGQILTGFKVENFLWSVVYFLLKYTQKQIKVLRCPATIDPFYLKFEIFFHIFWHNCY